MINDPFLPAAVHLTGPGAHDVLAPAVTATGGELVSCRVVRVQYRPRADLVVRYRCTIRTGASESEATLLAGTTTSGLHSGVLPIEAQTPDGTELSVGVWRWPFDPVLSALTTMVTPSRAAEHLADLVGAPLELEVVVYRPTERAVVRARGPSGEVYVKVVPPAATDPLIRRHEALAAAGLPVPGVLSSGPGWLAMEALEGVTLRDRLHDPETPPPPAERVVEVAGTLSTVHLDDVAPVRSRLADAPHHAAMLATVLPAARTPLDEIVSQLGAPSDTTATIHGDLHDAQLMVDDRSVIGLLDLDDAGPGDPLDDMGTLLGHLDYRTSVRDEMHIGPFATALRAALAVNHDPIDVERHVAAVLVGLATGPFRLQQRGWEPTTLRVIELAANRLSGRDDPSGT